MSIEEITKFEEIYEKYWKLAYSIALKVLRNEADAEDVVHCYLCLLPQSFS